MCYWKEKCFNRKREGKEEREREEEEEEERLERQVWLATTAQWKAGRLENLK